MSDYEWWRWRCEHWLRLSLTAQANLKGLFWDCMAAAEVCAERALAAKESGV